MSELWIEETTVQHAWYLEVDVRATPYSPEDHAEIAIFNTEGVDRFGMDYSGSFRWRTSFNGVELDSLPIELRPIQGTATSLEEAKTLAIDAASGMGVLLHALRRRDT